MVVKPYLKGAFFISLLYLVFALAWILITDNLVSTFFPSLENIQVYQSYKGIFFVAVTALLLFLILRTRLKEQEQVDTALVKHKQFLELALEVGQAGIFTWNLEDNQVDYNDHYFNIIGTENKRGNAKSLTYFFTQFLDPADQKEVEEALKQLKKGEVEELDLQFRIINAAQKNIWLHTRARISGKNGNEPALITGISIDITRQKKLENELLENKVKYENLLSNVQGMVYRCDFSGDWPEVFISDGAIELTGLQPQEFIETQNLLGNFICEDDREEVWRVVNKSVKDRSSFAVTYRIRDKEGKLKWVLDRGKALMDENGNLRYLEGIVYDISDKVDDQEQLIKRVLETEQTERGRISKEIHDNVQQILTAAYLNFEKAQKEFHLFSEGTRQSFTKGFELLNQAIDESRLISQQLSPKMIEDYGILEALVELVDSMKSLGVPIEFQYNNIDESLLDISVQGVIYRICQESLTNTLKYAEATRVDVQLLQYADKMILTIEDNGKGFEMGSGIQAGSDLGIASMKNRARAINGFFQIDSKPGRGTNILLEVPLS